MTAHASQRHAHTSLPAARQTLTVVGRRLKTATSLDSCLASLTDRLAERGLISDSAGFLAEMVDQERRRSTRLPNGVALPYVRSAHVKVPSVAVATLTPSAWRIADAGDIELVVLLATPADASDDHLPNWERLAIRATQPTFRLACASSDSDEELERLVAGYVG